MNLSWVLVSDFILWYFIITGGNRNETKIIYQNKTCCAQRKQSDEESRRQKEKCSGLNECRERCNQINLDKTSMHWRKEACRGRSVKGRVGVYLVGGGTVARRPQQQQWLSQHPLGGPG